MPDIYDDMQGVAASILTEFAQGAMAYVASQPGSGPPDEPGQAVETVVPFAGTLRGVQSRYVDGSAILASDLQVTMPGTVRPDLSGFILADGVRYKIVRILPKPAAGVPVAFTVFVRR